MSLSRKRNRQIATGLGTVIGLIIVFTFVVSLINPGVVSTNDVEDFPTFTPPGTELPPPDPNPNLSGEPPYVHSSGYFQTFMPAGGDWSVSEDAGAQSDTVLSVVFQSGQRLAVIHNYIRRGVEVESAESLSREYLTETHFAEAWIGYESWQETARTVGEDRVTTDFALVSGGTEYLGRDITRLGENGWTFVTRLVVPANNPGLLDTLERYVVPAFVGYPQLQTLPARWPTYVDQALGYLFKRPAEWQLVAGGEGSPATFTPAGDADAGMVRVWAEEGRALDGAGDAEAWLLELVPGAEVIGTDPLARGEASGFQVAYTFRDLDGDPRSGLFVALRRADGWAQAANLQVRDPDVNLLEGASLDEPLANARRAVVEGFIPLPQADAAPAP